MEGHVDDAHGPSGHSSGDLPYIRGAPLNLPRPRSMMTGMSRVSSVGQRAKEMTKVQYTEKSQSFFELRKLSAGTLGIVHVLALIFGNISSGILGWWEEGLIDGYGNHLVCWAVMFTYFLCFCVIMAELMQALPFMGGLATYTRASFGPYWGYVIGQCELGEYTLYCASDLTYLGSLISMSSNLQPLWWALFTLASFGTLFMSQKVFFGTLVVLMVTSTIIPFAALGAMLPSFDPYQWAVVDFYINYFGVNGTNGTAFDGAAFNGTALNGTALNGTLWATNGTTGGDSAGLEGIPPFSILTALFPTSILAGLINGMPGILYDLSGIEMVPLMAEDCKDFLKDGPRALWMCAFMSVAFYTVLVILLPFVPPGAYTMSEAIISPHLDPLLTIYGIEEGSGWFIAMTFFANTMNISSTVAYTYGFTRLAYALARGGYMPTFMALSVVPGKQERIPWAACSFGVVVVLAVAALTFFEGGEVAMVLTVSGSIYLVIMYGFTGISYLYLWWRFPDLKRPWKSSFGPAAAVVVIIVSTFLLVILCYLHWLAMVICSVKLVVGMIFFYIETRHTKLVMSEEERYIQDHIDPQQKKIFDEDELIAAPEIVATARVAQMEPLLEEEEV